SEHGLGPTDSFDTSLSTLSTLWVALGEPHATRVASSPTTATQSPTFATLIAVAGSTPLRPKQTSPSEMVFDRSAPATVLHCSPPLTIFRTLYFASALEQSVSWNVSFRDWS